MKIIRLNVDEAHRKYAVSGYSMLVRVVMYAFCIRETNCNH